MAAAPTPGSSLSRPWRARLLAPAITLGLVAILMPTATANHVQDGITFDSLGGNEWWVDVQLGGNHDFYGSPEVRDSEGAWTYMDHPGWAAPGRYVKSYHVEPGHRVEFRVSYRESVVLSCWFTHPAGVEQCDGSETFAVTFTPSGTSEAIRLHMDSNQRVQNVYWRVMGTQGSWGGLYMAPTGVTDTTSDWASIVHVPEGEILQFLAHSADDWGGYAESGCFRWPAVTPVACPLLDYAWVSPPISYDGDQAHMEVPVYFYPAMGREGTTLQRVDVRFNGGDFHAMVEDRDDGSYSYQRYDQAPTTRSVAQFRAIASDGQVECDQVGYFWPPAGFPDRYNTGETIQFTNAKGVQGAPGWVQTNLYSSKPVVAVEAQVNGGPWKAIQKQSYCDWAGPMDLPNGSNVRFRGFFPDLTTYTSDVFVLPAGTTSTTTTTTTSGAFDATFTGVRGNEWWEQATVKAAGGTLSKVDVRLNGGEWKPMTKQSYGYTSSYRAVQGTIVQFKATSTTGATDLSDCYRWIPAANTDATKVACGSMTTTSTTTTTTSTTSTTGSAFDATFSGVKGNEWWVQASVSGNQPIQNVAARINCSEEWRSLTKQSYGWAASFHVPAGSKVDFRATSNVGNSDFSGGYIWPKATPATGC